MTIIDCRLRALPSFACALVASIAEEVCADLRAFAEAHPGACAAALVAAEMAASIAFAAVFLMSLLGFFGVR